MTPEPIDYVPQVRGGTDALPAGASALSRAVGRALSPHHNRRVNMKFKIEIRDYEAGEAPSRLTTDAIERAVQEILDSESADGIVIVEKED